MIRKIIACALFSLAASAVIPDEIISYQSNNDGTGNYDFSFETSNGLKRQETGWVVNAGEENQYIDVVGSYSYTDVDGKFVEVNYHADEKGFHIVEQKPLDGTQDKNFAPSVVATLLGK